MMLQIILESCMTRKSQKIRNLKFEESYQSLGKISINNNNKK